MNDTVKGALSHGPGGVGDAMGTTWKSCTWKDILPSWEVSMRQDANQG